jgi:hypothetical protein
MADASYVSTVGVVLLIILYLSQRRYRTPLDKHVLALAFSLLGFCECNRFLVEIWVREVKRSSNVDSLDRL